MYNFFFVCHLRVHFLWPLEPKSCWVNNIFSQLIKIVGWSLAIDVTSFDWKLADSEISWRQLNIQVELSSKTAVSQLLAYPSVSYFRPTCQPQQLFFFFPVVNWGRNWQRGWSWPREKMRCWKALQGNSCYWVCWWATECKDTNVPFGSEVNGQLWLSVSLLMYTAAFSLCSRFITPTEEELFAD